MGAMSDVESEAEGFQMERRVSEPLPEIVDPFAIASKKKVSYGSFASMSTLCHLPRKGCSEPLFIVGLKRQF